MSDHFLQHSPAFRDVIGPNPTYATLIETDAHEGPVYVATSNSLFFTTVPRIIDVPLTGDKEVSIKRLDLGSLELSTVCATSNMANGMTLEHDGKLLVCEQGTKSTPARISRLDPETGKRETVVAEWFGLPFNSPNDVVVRRDGTIWFTDPSYGYLQGFRNPPLVGDFVYRYDPATRDLSVVADSFNKPNGLAFSPDEQTLYIVDSAVIQAPGTYHVNLPHHVRAFTVRAGRQLVEDRLFAVVTPGWPDGIKLDSEGRVYVSSGTGVKVYQPDGTWLGEILAPGVANFTFGGPGKNVIYMCTDKAITAATIAARGA
jgi:gluconolactonase